MQSANRPSKGRLFHGLFLLTNYQSTGQCTAADEQQRSPQNNIAGIAGFGLAVSPVLGLLSLGVVVAESDFQVAS